MYISVNYLHSPSTSYSCQPSSTFSTVLCPRQPSTTQIQHMQLVGSVFERTPLGLAQPSNLSGSSQTGFPIPQHRSRKSTFMKGYIRWLISWKGTSSSGLASHGILSDIVPPPPTPLVLAHAISPPGNIQAEKSRPLSMSESTGGHAFLGTCLQGQCASLWTWQWIP